MTATMEADRSTEGMTLDLHLLHAKSELHDAARELAKLDNPSWLGLGTNQHLDLMAIEGTLKEMLVMVKKMQARDRSAA
jgi:hypothetical protein